jgi:ABC-type oligopeptide transport system substrate-binding subunit
LYVRVKVIVVLALVVVGSVIVTGCGSSKKSSSSSSTSTPSSGSGGTSTNSTAAQAAKQACQQSIKSNPAIAASKQGGLSVDCQKVADAAASGDLAKYKAAYGTFCNDLAAALPSGAQAAGKAACEQGGSAIP